MRLDLALVERGLARSRNQAAVLISEGKVVVSGVMNPKPSTVVTEATKISITGELYVARSAGKLSDALDRFNIQVPAVCLDVGASTGGFTQVLLERGAELVLAVDVGHGQLAAELREDPRVVNLEGRNIREISDLELGPRAAEVGLVVVDVSFISLGLVAQRLIALASRAEVVALIKPQFELDRSKLNKSGVVESRADRHEAVAKVIDSFTWVGYGLSGLIRSAVVGASGNQEYLAHFIPGELGKVNSDAIAELV